MSTEDKAPLAGSVMPKLSTGSAICNLIKEAADSIHASLAEDGISDSRRQYRKDLEQRLRNAISPNAPCSATGAENQGGQNEH